jgi:exonuclease SbcC
LIPLKIQIKNFLSYGPETQEIDFTRYQMICLSGKNGHGKSALLDAMTWAVWGQARKSSGQPKPDQGLLHLGERNMKVIFDFEFNHKFYRVRREFTFAYGKPLAYLEFGMFVNQPNSMNPDQVELISLTDKTIRKTQAKIELLLGLDFDSFINSAFIRQGNAGEFSHKSPKERKEILGNILGLGLYDKLRKVASEKARFLEHERQGLLKIHDRLLVELAQSLHLEEQVQALQDVLKLLKVRQATYEKDMQTAYQHKQQLEISQNLDLDYQQKLKNAKLDYVQGLSNLSKLRLDWKSLLAKIVGAFDKQLLEKQKKELEAKLNHLRVEQKNSWLARERLAKLKADYQNIQNSLLNEHDQKINLLKLDLQKLQTNFEHLNTSQTKLIQELSLITSLQLELDLKLQGQLQNQLDCDLLQKQFDRYKDFYQRLIVIGNNAKYLQDELWSKKAYLDQDCPACPLCAQNLPLHQKQLLTNQFEEQIDFARARVLRVGRILKDLKTKIYQQHQQLDFLQKNLQQVQIWQNQVEQNNLKKDMLSKELSANQVDCEQMQKLIIELKLQLDNLMTQKNSLMQNHALANDLNAQIKSCEQDLINMQYQDLDLNLDQLEADLTQINQLLLIDYDFNLIEQRALLLEQISVLVKDLKSQKKLILVLQSQINTSANFGQQLQDLEQKMAVMLRDFNLVKIDYEHNLQELGKLQEQLKKNNQTKHELANLKADLANLDQSSQDYKLLVQAFGKDGIQALLIEDAIPEIEQEANYLLGRLTDNQAQLFIESLRDLKSGGTKETLDIKISDNVGLRPYEMFSGGEAFRIDFALRIAISKLLAKRAGTALQTLIIDEGFGSQDEEGLMHIMEALYKIQDDFAKIIIVSHLNTMKEQFPVHFFINKTATGSVVSVIEQG